MSVLLLANVGLRDLLYKGDAVAVPRLDGERLFKEAGRTLSEFGLPMLLPISRYLLEDRDKLHVVLYGTDQHLKADLAERNRDTLHLAKIARLVLQDTLGPKSCQAEVHFIQDFSPHLYDDMLLYFRKELLELRLPAGFQSCCVAVVGGIPAANTGLMLAAIERFGDQCQVLYLARGATRPIKMDIGRQLQANVTRRVASEWLAARGFVEALRLLSSTGAPEWVVGVVRYAVARYHFDFDGAATALESEVIPATAGLPRIRERCVRLGEDLPSLRAERLPALMLECYYNAGMAYARGEYASFLGVCFRFQEALLRCMVEEAYPELDTRVYNKKTRAQWVAGLEGRAGLCSFLRSQQVNGNPLKYEECNRVTLDALVRYLCEGQELLLPEARLDRFRVAGSRLAILNELVSLRNRSIIAHDFEGVTEARINAEYQRSGGKTSPLMEMKAALDALDIQVGESPFDRAMVLALEGLR